MHVDDISSSLGGEKREFSLEDIAVGVEFVAAGGDGDVGVVDPAEDDGTGAEGAREGAGELGEDVDVDSRHPVCWWRLRCVWCVGDNIEI